MTVRRLLNGKGGVDSFDSYSAAPETADGQEKALRELSDYRKELQGMPGSVPQKELTAEEAEMVKENVSQNLVSIAKAHPDTQFYYSRREFCTNRYRRRSLRFRCCYPVIMYSFIPSRRIPRSARTSLIMPIRCTITRKPRES